MCCVCVVLRVCVLCVCCVACVCVVCVCYVVCACVCVMCMLAYQCVACVLVCVCVCVYARVHIMHVNICSTFLYTRAPPSAFLSNFNHPLDIALLKPTLAFEPIFCNILLMAVDQTT